MQPTKRTKIVCTIGPASHDEATLTKMMEAGMDVARLNFSHGTHDDHAKLIGLIRRTAEKLGRTVAILQDLQGPKVRVGMLPDDGLMLENGASVVLTSDPEGSLPKITVSHQGLHEDVREGDTFLLDDGLLELKVDKVEGRDIACTVIVGGKLTSHKGVNLPTATLSIPAITDKDKEDLRFGVEQKVDLVALSFVRSAKEVEELRGLIARYEKELGDEWASMPGILIVSKIEKHEAVKNIDGIIAATDAVMVARGDLGIEVPAQEVPVIQKTVIRKCLAEARPVIVATQMLDSMIRNPRPTRAEVSDVANAVIDHADAVMLSGESATGKYPVEAVTVMADIIKETEKSAFDDLPPHAAVKEHLGTGEAVSAVADGLARSVDAKAILVATASGSTARMVSRHRPDPAILGVTTSGRVLRQLSLSWGVVPAFMRHVDHHDELVPYAIAELTGSGMLERGDKIVIVAGSPADETGRVSAVEVREI